ncbi:vWA domain-containing protein [Methylomonas sp. DH-1]|uniref:VWA domain-containing protein n=1 Tax=Methylomonas sp. (strain DH-1) TaxID=1727196 RepID=UPI0007C8B33B|nr:vWA domain-containing protein [Methylomonas sp. DH-1]ANE54402.1 hypothetical protein AYM39_03825 [Methylomonas sp. DH-1]
MFRMLILAVLCAFGPAGFSVRAQPAALAGGDDIQVLIDVSGSMKQNDPDNLRIEAGRLLVELLPEGSRTGLWLFAEKTVPLIASDKVDATWKQQAGKALANIHSRGLYTHIEDAIRTALSQGFKSSGRKHLILLTDGFVDISKDIMQSADSRERILSEWIPKLQQQDIQVQTVALSDQADKELLEKLAFETGGWAEVAQSADSLQRSFLKMAQKAAPKTTLPLRNNKFDVDAGVREFSILVFKTAHAAPTQLVMPDGNKLAKQTMAANVSWLESRNYDLITVRQPAVGEWGLLAEVDPDNRVMIVTDLKLQLSEIPNFVGEHEAVAIEAHFTDRDRLITRADFLGMLSLEVGLDQQAPLKMAPAGKPGFFQQNLNGLALGKHSLKILADGKTFKREIISEIQVVAAPISVEREIDAAQRRVRLLLKPDLAVVDPAGMVVNAQVSRDGKPPETHVATEKDGIWQLELAELPPAAITKVGFNVMAKDRNGKPLAPAVKPLTIDDSWFQPAEPPAGAAVHAAEHGEHVQHDAAAAAAAESGHEPAAEHPSAESPPAAHAPPEQPHTPAEPTNWWLVGGILVAINLLFGVGGFFIHRYLKKSEAEQHQRLLERLS